MDITTREHLVRRASALPRRRLLAASALAGAVAPLLAAELPAKKKKCKKPKVRCGKKCCNPGECSFKKKGKRWNLRASCTITRGIDLPNGVTLDGKGKTITMAGPKTGYTAGGVNAGAGQASVINLTIDGGGLTEACSTSAGQPNDPPAIVFGQTSGRIENVTVTNVNCAAAIAASVDAAAPEQTIEVVNSKVFVVPPPDRVGIGINVGGPGHLIARVSGSEFTSAAILFNTNVDATVDGCSVAASFISGLNGSRLTVTNSTITNTTVGLIAEGANTTLTATGNTIVGPGPITTVIPNGIDFRPGSRGSVSNNAISNYFVDGPSVGCGIAVQPGAGPVDIGANTFPPPGNEQDVCLM